MHMISPQKHCHQSPKHLGTNMPLHLFSEKEVPEAISQMKNNKAPGPHGFSVEFYKRCWDIIKGYVMPMFIDL